MSLWKTNKRLASFGLATLGVVLIHLALSPAKLDEAGCRLADKGPTLITQVEQVYGITVEYQNVADAIPVLWQKPPALGVATPIQPELLCRYGGILLEELARYPKTVIREYINSLYLLDSLNFYGVNYGGTFLNGSLYLTAKRETDGYNRRYVRELIHHELSSAFFQGRRFPAQEWQAINPAGFTYSESTQTEIASIARGQTAANDALYRLGFLSAYGKSTMENDFNLYAEMLFVHPEQLRQLSNKYPRVAKKAESARQFYLGVSKQFTFN